MLGAEAHLWSQLSSCPSSVRPCSKQMLQVTILSGLFWWACTLQARLSTSLQAAWIATNNMLRRSWTTPLRTIPVSWVSAETSGPQGGVALGTCCKVSKTLTSS